MGNKFSKKFLINQGVKQGCVLSPLLFNIFLSDLPELVSSSECRHVKLATSQHLGGLFWADDVVLLSECEEELSKMITKLGIYSANNYLELNVDKTKGMVFNKSGRFNRNMLSLGNCCSAHNKLIASYLRHMG